MKNTIYIEQPSPAIINQALDEWETKQNYVLQEKSLKKLFMITYPLNSDIDDVLIKVCALNDFYSTNIYSPFAVASHIVELKIDDALVKGSPDLVNTLASVKISEGKTRNFYSFASKYCSHHMPEVYPIYDYFAEKMLLYLNKEYGFTREKNWKDYTVYKNVIQTFQKKFELENYSLKEIDKYLWITGKRYFPKTYKKI